MTLFEKTENAYNMLKWHEKLRVWNIQNKRFSKTINSFRENLQAEGVEKKDFKFIEKGFEILKDCDTCFSKRNLLLLALLVFFLTNLNCYLVRSFLNKESGVSVIFVLMLNIIFARSIFLVLREIKESLRIKNIYYFFLYEDLNDKTEKEDEQKWKS